MPLQAMAVMSFSPTWYLLEQEGLLSQACLCNGLTALRNASLGEKKGLYYSAFFELYNGFERLMKLIVVIDHMAQNDLSLPNEPTIKKYGHKLKALFAATKAICERANYPIPTSLGAEELPIQLLSFLDDFAHPGGRYSNINKLTGGKHQHMDDPLSHWGEIASDIMVKHATASQRNQAKEIGRIAGLVFGDSALNTIFDLDQQDLDVAGLHARVSMLDSASKHAVFALVQLISFLRDVLGSLADLAQSLERAQSSDAAVIPYMREFFYFAWADRAYVMRKRRWP